MKIYVDGKKIPYIKSPLYNPEISIGTELELELKEIQDHVIAAEFKEFINFKNIIKNSLSFEITLPTDQAYSSHLSIPLHQAGLA